MAKHGRLRVLNAMIETGLVPVFYHGEVGVAAKIVSALIKAGVACVGMGSKLVCKDLVAAGDFDAIRDVATQSLAIIQEIRSKHPLF